jgi:hypothetical protein
VAFSKDKEHQSKSLARDYFDRRELISTPGKDVNNIGSRLLLQGS